MRILCLLVFVTLAPLLPAFGGLPPMPISNEARIEAATHIFTTKAVTSRIVDERGKPRKEHPPWLVDGKDESFEITLIPIKSLYPSHWRPAKAIVVFYSESGAMTEHATKPLLNQERIYFVRHSLENGRLEAFCVNFTENLGHLLEVQEGIQRIKKVSQ
jgi:hypothetical protein